MDCGAPCEISGFAWDLAVTFSELLLQRGEPVLGNDEMARCAKCRLAYNRKLDKYGPWHVKRVQERRARFKKDPSNDILAREIIKSEHNSPDAHAFIDAVRERVEKEARSGKRADRSKLERK